MKIPLGSSEYIPPSVASTKQTSNTMENNITVLSNLYNLNGQRCLMMILPNKKIIRSENPYDMKQLGCSIKNFVQQKWEREAKQVGLTANRCKYA